MIRTIRDRHAVCQFLAEGRFRSNWEATGCDIEVFPHGDKWEWAVFRTFKSGGRWGRGIMGWSMGGSWRRPAPDEVHGRRSNQGDAWAAARHVVDRERAFIAARENVEMQRRTERVPL